MCFMLPTISIPHYVTGYNMLGRNAREIMAVQREGQTYAYYAISSARWGSILRNKEVAVTTITRQHQFSLMPSLHLFQGFFIQEGLKVGSIFDPIWRVDVDCLYLSAHAFFLKQRVHNKKAVAGNETVRPVFLVLVKLDCFTQRFLIFFKQRHLSRFP